MDFTTQLGVNLRRKKDDGDGNNFQFYPAGTKWGKLSIKLLYFHDI